MLINSNLRFHIKKWRYGKDKNMISIASNTSSTKTKNLISGLSRFSEIEELPYTSISKAEERYSGVFDIQDINMLSKCIRLLSFEYYRDETNYSLENFGLTKIKLLTILFITLSN